MAGERTLDDVSLLFVKALKWCGAEGAVKGEMYKEYLYTQLGLWINEIAWLVHTEYPDASAPFPPSLPLGKASLHALEELERWLERNGFPCARPTSSPHPPP